MQYTNKHAIYLQLLKMAHFISPYVLKNDWDKDALKFIYFLLKASSSMDE